MKFIIVIETLLAGLFAWYAYAHYGQAFGGMYVEGLLWTLILLNLVGFCMYLVHCILSLWIGFNWHWAFGAFLFSFALFISTGSWQLSHDWIIRALQITPDIASLVLYTGLLYHYLWELTEPPDRRVQYDRE